MRIIYSVFSIVLCLRVATCSAEPARPTPNKDGVIAIDVLLEPDATMVAKAKAVNAQLRANYPKGYALGSEQVPHITLAQCYIREIELAALAKRVERAAVRERPAKWVLTATGLDYGIWAGVAITTISVEHTQELDRFHAAVMDAVEPFRVAHGTRAAFSTTHELPKIDQDIVDYVENFSLKSARENYKPHVTVGVAHEDFVKQLKAQHFERFSFRPTAVAIYQLGNFGTAQKKLWEWKSN
jgi:2'-5' RNA ligase